MSNEMNKEMSQGTDVQTEERYQVTKRDLRKTAARYNFMACNIFNYESQMGPAIAWAMAPVLRKIYKKDDEYKMALNNHFNYFNSTTVMSSMILGATLAVERKRWNCGKRYGSIFENEFDGTVCRSGRYSCMGVVADDHRIDIRIYGTAGESSWRDYLAFVQYRILVCKIKDVPDRIYVRNKVDHKFRKTSDSIYRGGIYHGLKRSRSADCYFCKNNDSFEF